MVEILLPPEPQLVGRRVWGRQAILRLQVLQLAEQAIIFPVFDLRRIQNIVAVRVVPQLMT